MAGSLFRSSFNISPRDFPLPAVDEMPTSDPTPRLAVLGGGCFWCTEVVYRELDGVIDVVSGYSGGSAETADYRAVCTGETEHAEVIQITYDPTRTSFGQLLRIFFSVAHDPTQLNRQGNDIGTQYRSVVFYQGDEQRRIAEAYIAQLGAAGAFSVPIVTRLEPLEAFFEAESYHQRYAERNPNQPYIAAVALPKLDKLRSYFGESLKR